MVNAEVNPAQLQAVKQTVELEINRRNLSPELKAEAIRAALENGGDVNGAIAAAERKRNDQFTEWNKPR